MNVLNSLLLATNKYNVFINRNNFTKNGYIKVFIEGSISEVITLNESFIVDKYFKKHYNLCNQFEINNYEPNKIIFSINRISDKKESKKVSLDFTMEDETISNVSLNINIKKIYNNKEFETSFYLENDNNPLTNVKFDRKSYELSGEFNSLVYGASVINIHGEFKVKLTEMNYIFTQSPRLY